MEGSKLPRDVPLLLEVPQSLSQLADALEVTDARVLWCLVQLRETDRVVEHAGLWTRTAKGTELLAEHSPVIEEFTVLPDRTVYDYRQAYADAAAGVFGTTFVQGSEEHGGRVPHARAVEFNERLLSLIAECFAPDRIDQHANSKYGFHWILTPTDLHPLDD